MSDKIQGLSLVMAVYGDGARLAASLPEHFGHLDRTVADWECILVDDHSPDDSQKHLHVLRNLAPDRIKVARLSKNSGQIAALTAGIGLAVKPWVLTFDVDSVPALALLPALMALAREADPDVINWCRGPRSSYGPIRHLGSRLMAWLANRVTGHPLKDPLSPVKLMRHNLASQSIKHRRKRYFPAPSIIRLAQRPFETDLPMPRTRDESSFGPAILARLVAVFLAAYTAALGPTLALLCLAATGLGSGFGLLTTLLSGRELSLHLLVWSGVTGGLLASFCLGLLWCYGMLQMSRTGLETQIHILGDIP